MRVFSISRTNPHSALHTVHAPLISWTHTFPISESYISAPCMRYSGCVVSPTHPKTTRRGCAVSKSPAVHEVLPCVLAPIRVGMPKKWQRGGFRNGLGYKNGGQTEASLSLSAFAMSRNVVGGTVSRPLLFLRCCGSIRLSPGFLDWHPSRRWALMITYDETSSPALRCSFLPTRP